MKFPYIIAEIGSCFNTLDDCFKAIGIASRIGCSAIKFQCTTYKELYGVESDKAIAFDKNFVKKEWIEQLSKAAAEYQIDFICSAFSRLTYLDIDPFVTYHKIASLESKDELLISTVLDTDKHTIVSVGGQKYYEVMRTVEFIKRYGKTATILHCVVEYPCANPLLDNYYILRNDFRSQCLSVGISNHSMSTEYIPTEIDVIEQHFNPFLLENKPDSKHSIGTVRMKELVKRMRSKKSGYQYTGGEIAKKHKRALIADCDIAKGDELRFRVVTTARLLDYNDQAIIPTFDNIRKVMKDNHDMKLKAKRDYKQGDPIY